MKEAPHRASALLGGDLKGKSSPVFCAVAMALAFINVWISIATFIGVAHPIHQLAT